MVVFTKVREIMTDTLTLKYDIEQIKKKLQNQDKSLETVFNCLDELLEKQENPKPRRMIGYKRNKSIQGHESLIHSLILVQTRLFWEA
jgi:hypothetical protein